MGRLACETTPRSKRNFLSQTTSIATSVAATYSTSVVESAIYYYFILLQLTVAPPRMNTYSKVDFSKFMSDMKSKSV